MLQKTEAVISQILDYLEAYNCQETISIPSTLTIFQGIETVDFPRDSEGELRATIHPNLQGKDYEPLRSGDAMFLTFEGETIAYSESPTLYPVFINEAAYYEKGIAMCLTRKEGLHLQAL